MFLSVSEWIITYIIGIPFAVIVLIPTLIAVIYFVYLLIETIKYRSKSGFFSLKNMFKEETNNIPGYEPAVMGYLVNYQKIGRREICSTLFDLIGRGVIKITLKKGFVSDDDGEYILEKTIEEDTGLKNYEKELIQYLFKNSNKMNSDTLTKRLYKKNLNEKFYNKFLKLIQEEAKQYDFFNKKTATKKVRVYKIINKVVTIIASITSFLFAFCVEGLDSIDDFEVGVALLTFCLVTALILWGLKFLISFMFNITCYYNDFSEQGEEDYKKWMSFKKYLKNFSSIPNHPLMGITVWQRYYAYSIGLKCSKKFFEQMKKMKIMDNSIDMSIFETFNFIVSNVGLSTKKIKSISLDKYGGSHVDY